MLSSLRQNIGQLFIGGFTGTVVPEDFARLARLGKLGGVILFSRNLTMGLENTRTLNRELHALNQKQPLMIGVDQEGGRVQRLRAPFPELPSMRAVGSIGNTKWAELAGAILGESLGRMGFDLNYAPVLDVDSNPTNPVIGDRAFSSEVDVVCQMGSAFIQGIQSEGIAACGKHFPGHGDTTLDSHYDLPRLEHSRERLNRVELPPFVTAARAGVALLMTAHVVYSQLDPDWPATLSPKIVTGLLRESVGFDGVIVSDDLEMKAIANEYFVPEAAVQAIAAGCDQVLICHHPELLERAHETVIEAVTDKRLNPQQVQRSIARVLAMKSRYVRTAAVPSDISQMFPQKKYQTLMNNIDINSPRSVPGGPDPTESLG
ncbi:MAG: beta-N-acetylhexosaminidase [Myxococcales bacterium]|nr:beta-N-acetylhexosaminidase [Myxococcales bacterium]